MGMEVIFLKIKVRIVGKDGKRGPTFVEQENPKRKNNLVNLSSDYVHDLSQGISSRIRQRDSLHANSQDLAARAKFR